HPPLLRSRWLCRKITASPSSGTRRTMPALFPQRQSASVAAAWFASPAGQALLASESTALQAALAERPAPPWLWLQPLASGAAGHARGVRLAVSGDGWAGVMR